ncbi:MAG: hypothetical protein LBD41_07990, partial [Clostridiales Family XIII bacterium]|nr:hypothetical protein [Clostridiales Family XIII bacterium]
MITKIPFDWSNPSHTKIIDAYKITGLSGYEGYYPCDFQLYGRNISGIFDGKTYRLEVAPNGDIPVFWISGIIENKDNHYSAFVKDVN